MTGASLADEGYSCSVRQVYITFGTKRASLYQLGFRRSFSVAGDSSSLPRILFETFTQLVARRKVGMPLKSHTRKFDMFKEIEYI